MAKNEQLKISQPEGETKRKSAAKPKTNENGKPLVNKNTVSQSVKPSKAPISLPAMPGILPDLDAFEKLTKELEAKQNECLHLQERLSKASSENETLRVKNGRQAKIIAQMGIGTTT